MLVYYKTMPIKYTEVSGCNVTKSEIKFWIFVKYFIFQLQNVIQQFLSVTFPFGTRLHVVLQSQCLISGVYFEAESKNTIIENFRI